MSTEKEIYGLVGYPVKHSLSPLMHNAAFSELGINAEYRLFEKSPEGLEKFLLKEVFEQNILGFNITVPHKIRAKEIIENNFPGVDRQLLEQDAYYVKLTGAINTVKRVGDRLIGFNTDAAGFFRSLKEDLDFDPKGENVLVIGCGGAGRAVIAALSWKNIGIKKIYINDIKKEALNSAREYFSKLPQPQLREKLEFIYSDNIPDVLKKCDLLVNATPVGMDDDNSPVEKAYFHEGLRVYDLVYNRTTRLVKEALACDLRATSGLNMLLYQGATSFELWTGQKPPLEIMRQALNKACLSAGRE